MIKDTFYLYNIAVMFNFSGGGVGVKKGTSYLYNIAVMFLRFQVGMIKGTFYLYNRVDRI